MGVVQCANVPQTIAAVISGKQATLIEMQTIYGIEDMWNLLEIITVKNHNEKVMSEVD